MKVSRLRLAGRLARAEARRAKGRTVLVMLLIGLPAAGMTLGSIVLRTGHLSADERRVALYGQADVLAQFKGLGEPDRQALERALPKGSRIEFYSTARDRLVDGNARHYFEISSLDLSSPLLAGRFGAIEGRAPLEPGEAVVSIHLARSAGIEVGDRVRPDRLDSPLKVVGVVPAKAEDALKLYTRHNFRAERHIAIADVPGGGEGVDDIETWSTRKVSELDPSGSERGDLFLVYLLGGAVLAVLGLIVSAAMAVGARRQLRTIGLMTATGADSQTVVHFLLAQGAWLGGVASAAGVALGVGAAHLAPQRWVDQLAGRALAGIDVAESDLATIVGLCVLAATVAAWSPARSSSTVPTLAALAGRRPVGRVQPLVPALGLAGLIGGSALLALSVAGSQDSDSNVWTLAALVGVGGLLGGVVMVSPWVVSVAHRLTKAGPIALRLAGRSLERNRLRAAAVIGAIGAVAALFVAGTSMDVSGESERDASADLNSLPADHAVFTYTGYTESDASVRNHEGRDPGADLLQLRTTPDGSLGFVPYVSDPLPLPPYLVKRVAERVPKAKLISVELLGPHQRADLVNTVSFEAETGSAWLAALATAELLDTYAVPESLRRDLRAGRVISLAPVPDLVERVSFHGAKDLPMGGSFDSPMASHALPHLFVSESAARTAGLERVGTTTLMRSEQALSQRQHNSLKLLAEDVTWEAEVEASPNEVPPRRLEVWLPDRSNALSAAMRRALLFAAVVAVLLAVVFVGLALAAKDSEDERQVLSAVGARPAVLRWMAAARAWVLTTAGVLIAMPAGLAGAYAIIEADNPTRGGFRVDVAAVLTLAVLFPLIASAAVLVGTRARDAIRRPLPDHFLFAD